jgi:hypothetical protein
MTRFPEAPRGSLVIVGDQALTEAEYAAYRREREWINTHRRERRANDPEYRERMNAYFREWKRQHRDELREYNREWMRRYRAARRAA